MTCTAFLQPTRRRTAQTLLLAALTLPAAAQNAALGSIAGEVRDASGAVIPGANVVIKNPGTGASRTLTTDAQGHYAAGFLQPGTYEIILGGGTLGTVDRKDVPVTVGAPTTVDATLPAATVTTDVTVDSEAPLVDTEKVEGSQVVDEQIVTNVPVNSRRFESFVLLTPNVVPDGNTGLIGYRGISGVYNTNIVDGANNNQQFFSEARGRSIGAPYVFPVDAIREFESSAVGYSAELGGAAGGIINAVTKAGTNQLHGDALRVLPHPRLQRARPIQQISGPRRHRPRPRMQTFLSQPVKVQHEFGISVGGPILTDKLFFHFTYDGFRKTNPIVYTSSFNTSNQVANLVHLCDGGTTALQDGATIYPTTIPGISSTQCSAVVAAVQSQLGAFQRNVKQDIFFPRLDYQLNGKTHLSAEYLWQNFHQPDGYNTSVTVSNGGVGNNGTADFHERILIANAETALSSTAANVVHFQFGRDLETDSTNVGGPFNSLSNLVSFGETSALPSWQVPRRAQDISSPTFTPRPSDATASRPASTSTSFTSRSPTSSAATAASPTPTRALKSTSPTLPRMRSESIPRPTPEVLRSPVPSAITTLSPRQLTSSRAWAPTTSGTKMSTSSSKTSGRSLPSCSSRSAYGTMSSSFPVRTCPIRRQSVPWPTTQPRRSTPTCT